MILKHFLKLIQTILDTRGSYIKYPILKSISLFFQKNMALWFVINSGLWWHVYGIWKLECEFRKHLAPLYWALLWLYSTGLVCKQANVQHPIMGNIKTFIFIAGEPLCIIICDLQSKSTQEIKMQQGFSVLLIINILGPRPRLLIHLRGVEGVLGFGEREHRPFQWPRVSLVPRATL